MQDFVSVYSKKTGRKRLIPEHWFDIPSLGDQFQRTPLQVQADEAEQLKGKALEAALGEAGLPKIGTADEKRAALEAHLAEQAVVDASIDPLGTTTEAPHGGENEQE